MSETVLYNNRIPLVIITGPTAVGKTDLSVKFAKKVGGEIISADSMQVYKKMDIGTAKIMPQEMDGIKHHMIDIFMPDHSFNVSEFKNISKKITEEIYNRGNIPIIAGGTAFYIQALLNDISFDPEEEDGYKEELQRISEMPDGPDELYKKLQEIDPESAEIIHKNNVKRVIRALDFYHKTSMKISEHNETQKSKKSPYNFLYFVLTMDRKRLYDRINQRVDIMIENGLIEEVKMLLDMGYDKDLTSMQGIGYKEIIDYLNGNCTKDECIYNIKINTRHFAKRQLTWYRREKDVIWINKDEFENEEMMLKYILEIYDKNIGNKK
ncbi:tRNA (adenosine(37)-N6)-dimethylallyltransferase MiaA [Eubacterium ruminantium]|uniref:tRNA (adenosine(37)-N6)-dimethylallyltransferase MiaA n=1 Tax=Eubacterium ruminantium TaxID=42322 RepID=UPI001567FAEA|nr:tRNA (adenosine(37)-N6)-dimethylallyltransferase MiaA [Eubacterium ruminantium]